MENRVEQLERSVRRLQAMLVIAVGVATVAIVVLATSGFMKLRAITGSQEHAESEASMLRYDIDSNDSDIRDVEDDVEAMTKAMEDLDDRVRYLVGDVETLMAERRRRGSAGSFGELP